MFLVLLDAVVTVNGVDLSDHCSSVEIEDEADEVETTSFGVFYKEYDLGMKDVIVTLEVFQDFAAGKVDETLWPLYVSGERFDVTVKPESAPVSETNPVFVMTTQLHGYSPIAGAVGEALTTDLTFRNAAPDGLVRPGAYVGIDSDGDPYFDEDGWYVDRAGVDVDTDPYVDVAGAPDADVTVFLDPDGDVAVEV